MLLLHMSVQSGVAKIRLVAVLTLKIAAVHIVLRPPLVLVLSIAASAAVVIGAIFITRLTIIVILILIMLFAALGPWGRWS